MVGIQIILKNQYALAQTAQGWKSAVFKVPGVFFAEKSSQLAHNNIKKRKNFSIWTFATEAFSITVMNMLLSFLHVNFNPKQNSLE